MIFQTKYKKPILLVGSGVRMADAVAEVHSFVRKTNIPLLTTMNAVDLAPEEFHIGFIGTHGNRIANMIINECDLIISIGARLGLRQVGRYTANFAPHADLIRVDIDENELGRNIKTNERQYRMDAKDFMQMLLTEDVPNFSAWKEQCLEAKALLKGFDQQEGNVTIEKIGSFLPENAIVSVDVGMNQCWCAQSLVLKGNEGRILISGGYGTMGCALPFSIGASISRNNGIVYCISGDGGMQMNIQELETIRRENLPIKIFILNNRVLGKISETQHFNHGDRFANTASCGGYSVPDFKKIAEAYGIKAATLASYNELENYTDWISDVEPCLFDISLPENSFLTPKIKWETGKIFPNLTQEVVDAVNSVLRR